MRIILLLFLAGLSQPAFAQVDTVPPQLICKSQITANAAFLGYVLVPDTSFIESVTDNATPPASIELGIRKSCTGTGFPENIHFVIYNCDWYSFHTVDLWARDAAGNVTTCSSKILLQDLLGNCDPQFLLAAVLANDPYKYIDQVDFQAGSYNCLGDTFQTDLLALNGPYSSYGTFLPDAGYNSKVIAAKNINPLNGVSTADLALISKHLLDIQPFNSPWQYLAADANQDGQVTTNDMVVIHKILLGLLPEFPGGAAWRFVPDGYVFPDPANPLSPTPPGLIEVPNTADPAPGVFRFKGVKLGDVNFSADPEQ